MNAHRRMYRVDTHPAPVASNDDDIQQAIDTIMAASVRRAAENERLRTALEAILAAFDAGGEGMVKAVEGARMVVRGK